MAMKWFFALNHEAFEFERYRQMVVVAVYTAAAHTSLEPYCLYDGTEDTFAGWLRTNGVKVISCRSFLYERLSQIANERQDANILRIGAGALLRVEIPLLASRLGLRDEFALYTDVDVMFMRDVSALNALRPTYFAVGPEFDVRSVIRMNTGVMLMNLRSLLGIDDDFRRFLCENLSDFVHAEWDQGAYKQYFHRIWPLVKVMGTKWDQLPPTFNWKPQWGINDHVHIVHFHGAKPTQGTSGAPRSDPRHWTNLPGAHQKEYSAVWHDRFAEATKQLGHL